MSEMLKPLSDCPLCGEALACTQTNEIFGTFERSFHFSVKFYCARCVSEFTVQTNKADAPAIVAYREREIRREQQTEAIKVAEKEVLRLADKLSDGAASTRDELHEATVRLRALKGAVP